MLREQLSRKRRELWRHRLCVRVCVCVRAVLNDCQLAAACVFFACVFHGTESVRKAGHGSKMADGQTHTRTPYGRTLNDLTRFSVAASWLSVIEISVCK